MMEQKKKDIFIFDLDDTLYQKKDELVSIVNSELFDNLDGDKILLSNGSYYYCIALLKKLNIIDKFKAIFTADILQAMKPNPLVYNKISYLCGLSLTEYNIYFFDNMAINLVYPKQLGWNTILILPLNEEIILSADKKVNDMLVLKANKCIDYKYDNINEAISRFLQL